MQDYYKILNVSRDSSDDEIKKAYLKLIKKYHPDVYSGDKVFAEQQTALITEAYTTLKNKELRMKYDRKTFGQSASTKDNQATKNSQTKTAKQTKSQTKTQPQKESEQTKTKQDQTQTPQKKEKQKNANLTDEQKQAKNQKIILDLAIISLVLLLFLLLFFPLK